jgi:imidazolonepropionase-like amidohydrolase
MGDQLGTLERRKLADLILLDGDPLGGIGIG